MSLSTSFGRNHNVFEETPDHARRLVTASPVLSRERFERLLKVDDADYPNVVIDLSYPRPDAGYTGLKMAIERICAEAEAAVRDGKVIIVLSDRAASPQRLPVPAAMATGAVHHHLTRLELRSDANLVIETASVRDPHHFAVLLGLGATAIYPYLAYASIADMLGVDGAERGCANFAAGINKGLLKIMSKMGISVLPSYRGAQLFEAIGLHDEVISLCFEGVVSRLQGASFDDLEADLHLLADAAASSRKPLFQGGLLNYVHGGEYHAFNPDVVTTLIRCARSGDYEDYKTFARLVNERPVATLRDLLDLRLGKPIPIDQVEPIEAITARFDCAGMSLGALGPEAHEALAIAMNRLGGRSNSGEGGEDPARYGTERTSGGLRALWRDAALPGQRRGPADQDRAGRQARRGRPAASQQGGRADRPPALHHARRAADFAAAASRYLLDRGPGAAHFRPQAGQPAGAGIGQAGGAGRRRHGGGRGCQGLRGPDHHLRLRWRHRCQPADLGQVRRHPVRDRAGRDPPGAAGQQAAREGARAGRWRPQDWSGCHQGGHAGRGKLRFRHRADDRAGLQVPAHLSSEQLCHRHRHAERGIAQQALRWPAGNGRELPALRGAGNARAAGGTGPAQHGRPDRAHGSAAAARRHHRQAAASGPESPADRQRPGSGR